MESASVKYRRVLLKLSGEALLGEAEFGIDPGTLGSICAGVAELRAAEVEVALVIFPPGDGETVQALDIDRDGEINWRVDEPTRFVERVALVFRSEVATRISLSKLRFAYRETEPGA